MRVNEVDEGPRVWFITGTSTGLGRAIAEAALARGERVAATARDLLAVKDLLDRGGDRVRAYALDVTDPTTVTEAVAGAVEDFGRIDVLVNNAGHGLVGALEELSEEEIHAVLNTNVLGVATVTRAVLPHMRARRSGHIVQMSSVGGVVGNPGHAAYATSKFALEGMSEALAGEVRPLGIRVTIVEPGPFRTDFAGRSMRFATQISDTATPRRARCVSASPSRTEYNPTIQPRPRRRSCGRSTTTPRRCGCRWGRKPSPASARSCKVNWPIWTPGRRFPWTLAIPAREPFPSLGWVSYRSGGRQSAFSFARLSSSAAR